MMTDAGCVNSWGWPGPLTACELPTNSSWCPFADTVAAVTLKSIAGVVETTCSTFRLLKGVLASCGKTNNVAVPSAVTAAARQLSVHGSTASASARSCNQGVKLLT